MAECVVMGAGGGTKAASGIVERINPGGNASPEYWLIVNGLDFTPKRVSIVALKATGEVLLADCIDTIAGAQYGIFCGFEYGLGKKIMPRTFSTINIEANGFKVGPKSSGIDDSYFWIASS